MANHFTDVSGNIIPPDQTKSAAGVERIIAVPPVRDRPNEQAIEFQLAAYGQLAAAGVAYVDLTDFTTTLPFAGRVPEVYRGRFESMLLFCPDMVAAAAPYLAFQLLINGQLANAWGQVPIYPRVGIGAPGFEMQTDLPPNATIGLRARNTDPANAHFLGVYLYGWYWPKDLQQG